MHQKIFITLLFTSCLCLAYSQTMPKGMNYQAVARNLKGEILPNESIALKINLVSNQNRERKEYFSEIHTVTTNELGLFSLIVGEGRLESGAFNEVPWATENIWMEVAIRDKTQSKFNTISNSKLFAVPYAMHAITANSLVGDNSLLKDQNQGTISSFSPPGIGVISTSWSVLGNQKTDASGNIYRLNSLGTTDFVDLFLITDNVERMRITASGDIKTKLNFEVGKSVLLNAVSGSTINNGPFTVDKMSPTIFTGTVRVDKSIKLNDSLVVSGMKPTILSGTLTVDKATYLKNTLVVDKSTKLNDSLTVTGMKPTILSGTLTVDKAVDLNNTLNVDKSTTLNDSLTVTGMKPTLLTGTLTVDKAVDLNNTLNVDKSTKLNDSLTVTSMKPTVLTGTLTVDKAVDLNNTLNVDKSTKLNDSLTVTSMKPTVLTGTLTVDKAVDLNNTLNVDKATFLNDSLTVTGMKPTRLTGTLVVDKGLSSGSKVDFSSSLTLHDTLRVADMAPTILTGKLRVDKPATFNDSVIINGVINLTKDVADGGYLATFYNTNNGNGDGIKIRLGRAKASYTLPSSKDTLTSTQLDQIKSILNCTTSISTKGTNLGNIILEGALTDLKYIGGLAVGVGNMLIGKINSGIGLPYNISTPINSGIGLPYNISTPINSGLSLPLNISTPINTGIGLPYNLASPINTGLGLPIPFGPYSIPKIDFPKLAVPGFVVDVPVIPTFTLPGFTVVEAFTLVPKLDLIPKFDIVPKLPDITIPAIPNFAIPALPTLTIPALPTLTIPAIPNIDLTSIGVTEIDPTDISFWGVPNLCLIDVTTSPLNHDNVFIRFTDKDDLKLGSIKAVSVADWAVDYLNPAFLYGLREALTSSVADKKHARYHFIYEAKKALLAYAKIGVEYSSGNGDYAEWLMREKVEEAINPGDIVGVIGGKISKDLTHAEQVMAISHNPIILGNIPAEGKVAYGNNVAFMGQVPVKVMGPVASGDYIVGNVRTPGYGVAKKQIDMTLTDFKYAVGRSWENNPKQGPVMVNTVIGVHNGDYIKILKKYEEKFEKTESRLHTLEQKVEVLLDKSSH